MTSKEALLEIKDCVEYITRLDYVDPIVRGEVRDILYEAYHKTTPEFDIIEKDLDMLDLIKKHKHIFLYAIFINQDNYCGQEVRELEKRDEFKKEINTIKEYLDDK